MNPTKIELQEVSSFEIDKKTEEIIINHSKGVDRFHKNELKDVTYHSDLNSPSKFNSIKDFNKLFALLIWLSLLAGCLLVSFKFKTYLSKDALFELSDLTALATAFLLGYLAYKVLVLKEDQKPYQERLGFQGKVFLILGLLMISYKSFQYIFDPAKHGYLFFTNIPFILFGVIISIFILMVSYYIFEFLRFYFLSICGRITGINLLKKDIIALKLSDKIVQFRVNDKMYSEGDGHEILGSNFIENNANFQLKPFLEVFVLGLRLSACIFTYSFICLFTLGYVKPLKPLDITPYLDLTANSNSLFDLFLIGFLIISAVGGCLLSTLTIFCWSICTGICVLFYTFHYLFKIVRELRLLVVPIKTENT
jgi:hypothetical protein